LALAIACSVVPDLDALGFWAGVPYGSALGHRGITHSLFVAAVLAAVLSALRVLKQSGERWSVQVYLFLFISAASHGVVDAFTNGGLGVALLAPFTQQRYFMPLRPIRVSPIGVSSFISERGLAILASEVIWLWVPMGVIAAIGLLVSRPSAEA
jgi:inner membrane protein